MVALSPEVESVLQQVKTWPAESRWALAQRVLETLEVGSAPSSEVRKGSPLEQVIGLWSSGSEAPSDEECHQILADELRRKHAS